MNAASRLLATSILAAFGTLTCSDNDTLEHAQSDPLPLNVVALDSTAVAVAEIEVDSVRLVHNSTLHANGVLTYDANAVAMVGPKVEGRIVRVFHDLGDRVSRGTRLAILESQEVGDIRAEVGRAQAEADLARQNYEREQRLQEENVSSEKEMLEARAAFESATAALHAAKAKLRVLGALEADTTGFALIAPLAGTVVERNAVVGQIAGPEDQIFTIVDLMQLWLVVDIYDKDLTKIAAGQDVRIRTDAFRDAIFNGRVSYVGQILDPESHTIKVRVLVENPGQLRPGMFARAEVELPEPDGTLAVPRKAVQKLEGETVVFIPQEGCCRFQAIPIRIGAQVDVDFIVVLSGVQAGQRIVGQGSFFLKSELLKASFGDAD